MTTTTVAVSRTNLGPLTTVFTAPAECTSNSWFFGCYSDGAISTVSGTTQNAIECDVGREWDTCEDTNKTLQQSCLPSTTRSLGDYHFWSPGIDCPDKWTTAWTATSSDDGSTPTPGQDPIYTGTLLENETAVLCCPSAYTADSGGWCVKYLYTGTVSAQDCSTTTDTISFAFGYSGAQVLSLPVNDSTSTSTYYGLVWVFDFYPGVQINFRAEDLATSTATSSNADTSGAAPGASATLTASATPGATSNGHSSGGLSRGAIAGIAVGVGAAVLLVLAGLFWLLRRRRSARMAAQQSTSAPTNDPDPKHELEGAAANQASGRKSAAGTPELDDRGAGPTRRYELAADSHLQELGGTPRLELDASTIQDTTHDNGGLAQGGPR